MREVDDVFVALPHGRRKTSSRDSTAANRHVLVIDIAGDFAAGDPEGYPRCYGRPHPAPAWLEKAASTASPSARRAAVRWRRLVANPGCFATGILLALDPLASDGRLHGSVCVSV